MHHTYVSGQIELQAVAQINIMKQCGRVSCASYALAVKLLS